MPTVIDSLVVELGIDPRKFAGGEKEVRASLRRLIQDAGRGAKDTERGAKDLGSAIAGIKREALGLVGVFLGGQGAKQFLNFVTNLDASTDRLAGTMGMATERLSAWQGAAKRMGGTAESITSSLGGVNQEMVRLQLTGQASMLPLLNFLNIGLHKGNGELKTASELLLDVAGAMEKVDKRRAAGLLSLIPGMNQDTINLLLLGRTELEKVLVLQEKLGGTTKESAAAAKEYQAALSDLDRSATDLGRSLVTLVGPALTTVFDKITKLFSFWKRGSGITDAERHQVLREQFGEPPAWLKNLTGEGSSSKGDKLPVATPTQTSGAPSSKDQEAYIRAAAAARGIDPNIAVAVAKSEGLYNWKSTIPGEESYGPFQLHYGGRGQKGGLAAKGLGDDFTKRTGLDAADPANWRQGVDFALDHARNNGWGAWYGWKGLSRAGIPLGPSPSAGAAAASTVNSGGNSTVTSSTTVQQLNVNTQATDAQGIARDIVPQLKRTTDAAMVNSGAQ